MKILNMVRKLYSISSPTNVWVGHSIWKINLRDKVVYKKGNTVFTTITWKYDIKDPRLPKEVSDKVKRLESRKWNLSFHIGRIK